MDVDHVFFDIDGTLIDEHGTVVEALLSSLQALRDAGVVLGLATSQSLAGVTEFLAKIGAIPGPEGLFTSWLVLEDGHVLIGPGKIPARNGRVLTSQQALDQMHAFRDAFQANWTPADDPEVSRGEWGHIQGLSGPAVCLSPDPSQEVASVSIWEKGPYVTDPEYDGEYDLVMDWARRMAAELGLDQLSFVEVGNGTLRVLERGRNKGTALLDTGLDLGKVILVGDGYNDLEAATVVRKAGGNVVAVANAIEELKALAHLVTSAPASQGVVELTRYLLSAKQLEETLQAEYLPLYQLLCTKEGTFILDEYTLRDAIREKYLKSLVVWLLGCISQESASIESDRSQPGGSVLVAQLLGSPWQVAWTVIGLLDAMEVLQDQKLEALVKDCLLGDEPTASLVEPHQAIPWLLWVRRGSRTGVLGEQVDWHDWYDTAVVIWALLRAKKYYSNGRGVSGRFWSEEVDPAIENGLQALQQRFMGVELYKEGGHRTVFFRMRRYEEDLLLHGGESLAVTLPTLLLAAELCPKTVARVFGVEASEFLALIIRDAVEFVERAKQESADRLIPFARKRMISALLDVLERTELWQTQAGSPDQTRQLHEVVTAYCDHVDALTGKDVEADTAIKSARLTVYLKAGRVLGGQHEDARWGTAAIQVVNPQIVLGMLRSILSSIAPHRDGSVYHSLDATLHALPCLTEVCLWKEAGKSITGIYDEVLKELAFPGLFTEKTIAELSRRETEIGERKKHIEKQRTRLRIFFYSTLAVWFVIAVGAYLWARLANFYEWLQVMLAVLAVVTGFITWLYDRGAS